MGTQKSDGPPALEKLDEGRRRFIKKVAAGSAFAIPMIASFSTDGLSFNKAEAAIGFPNQRLGLLERILRLLGSIFRIGPKI